MLSTSLRRSVPAIFLFCTIVFSAILSHAQRWAADTGSLDPSTFSNAIFENSNVYVKPATAGTRKVILRYPVLPIGDALVPTTGSQCRQLVVREKVDSWFGVESWVWVRLRSLNLQTGQVETLLTADSSAFGPTKGFGTAVSECITFDFDFTTNDFWTNHFVYWIEAVVSQVPGHSAALGAITLVRLGE